MAANDSASHTSPGCPDDKAGRFIPALTVLGGFYPRTAFLPVVTWSAMSVIAVLAAWGISRNNRWLAAPYVAFGLLAALGGAVGSHPNSFAAAGPDVSSRLLSVEGGPPRGCAGCRGQVRL